MKLCDDGKTLVQLMDRSVFRWEAELGLEIRTTLKRLNTYTFNHSNDGKTENSEDIGNLALHLNLPEESTDYADNIDKRIACIGLFNGCELSVK